jgi:hypothetical protein
MHLVPPNRAEPAINPRQLIPDSVYQTAYSVQWLVAPTMPQGSPFSGALGLIHLAAAK